MRWVPFVILSCLLLVVQTTLGRVLTFNSASVGTIGPDLLAIVAVFVALHVQAELDAAIAAWVLGLALDLAAAGGAGSTTVIGPMPVAYALGAWIVYRVREAFFRERMSSRAFLALLFCGVSHAVWVTAQSLLAGGAATWAGYGSLLLQAAALAVYTAALTPLGFWALLRIRKWILLVPSGRARRAAR